jgi:hypothetical protein
MKLLTVFGLLFSVSPVFSQPRLYTNADLGQPLSAVASRPSAAAAAAILAPYQTIVPLQASAARWWPQDGRVVVVPSSATAGPFGEFAAFSPARRLDGTLLTSRAWQSNTYLPWSYGRPNGGSYGLPRRGGPGRAARPVGSPGTRPTRPRPRARQLSERRP